MLLRTGLLMSCCALLTCTGLAACTASAPKGPDVAVSTPSVGRPAPPTSAQAALSRMAFTPYAALGQSNNDGLAPNESSYTLSQEFTDAIGKGPLAGNLTLSSTIANDVLKDAAVKKATQQWSACMTRNGYTYQQPQNVFFDQIQKMFGGKRQISIGDTVSA